ncbi:MAG: hypothetical protein IKE43_01570 [Coriobacteriales bacterium]|nr:hypothetical protein [Coriobacteriales bacterium]
MTHCSTARIYIIGITATSDIHGIDICPKHGPLYANYIESFNGIVLFVKRLEAFERRRFEEQRQRRERYKTQEQDGLLYDILEATDIEY